MAAPKGNKYALGHHFGRSKTFESAEELQLLIDRYFKSCDGREGQIYSKQLGALVTVPMPIPYTIEGLCVALDCTRQSLLNYQKVEGYNDFFDTISRAKDKVIQNKVERGLDGVSPSQFAIFDLVNNSEYRNASNVDVTTAGEKVEQAPTIVFKKYDNEGT